MDGYYQNTFTFKVHFKYSIFQYLLLAVTSSLPVVNNQLWYKRAGLFKGLHSIVSIGSIHSQHTPTAYTHSIHSHSQLLSQLLQTQANMLLRVAAVILVVGISTLLAGIIFDFHVFLENISQYWRFHCGTVNFNSINSFQFQPNFNFNFEQVTFNQNQLLYSPRL